MTDSALADIVQQAEARIGTTLKGKWRIDRLVGVGGMASVYAATHRNNKRVAIKMLHPTLSMLRTVRERFQREGYVANSVGHSGAVSVDDDDVTEDGCAFLVMELLEGETLEARRVRCGGRLPPEDVLGAMEQVLGTLAAAHAKGIIHRDLKPDNLFLTLSGEAKVLDFGIARLRDLALSTAHTHTANLMGTPAFMPPEQARARWDEVDGQSDIWAVGATMFTLLTGEGVHRADTFNELLISAATTTAPSLGTRLPDLQPSLVGLVDRALAFHKSDRWADADTLRRAVRKSLVLLDEPSAPEVAQTPAPAAPVLIAAPDSEWTDEPTTTAPSVDRNSAPVAQQPGVEASLRWPSSLDRALAAERVTTTPGLEQNLARRMPSSTSVTWALCALLGVGIALALVFAKRGGGAAEHAPASNTSAQASASDAPPRVLREPRVTLESSLPRAPSVQELALAASGSVGATAAKRPVGVDPKPGEPLAAPAAPRGPKAIVLSETPEPAASGFVHQLPAPRRELDDAGLLDNPYH